MKSNPTLQNEMRADNEKQKPVMSHQKKPAYRISVAVIFGLIGFGVNFFDIEFMEGATFKISILAGLFFPLVIALAWGWRYGLISALAGGCQTLWWLWHGDGWGILYSVPVFTLWIVWHGWWSERRAESHRWFLSQFAVEIPFRIVIELGFLLVFSWLVSLNPPPWNPAISWDNVNTAWLQTVVVKHVIEAYVMLMAAYVALSLTPVRRFFGLPLRSAQRDTMFIYVSAILFGLLLWALDAIAHYFLFSRAGDNFWSIAVHGASIHELYMRSVYITIAILAGIILARLNGRRVELQETLDHQNRILAAIRNVNQLIVREKDPHHLLDEACRLLVETRGYFNAWIVLTENGLPIEPFFHAGFDNDFSAMTRQLRAGNLPTCAQKALLSDVVQVYTVPATQCVGCPLSSKYHDRSGLSLRLDYAGRVFGWMSLSCPTKFATKEEEQDLLKEVAGDIAFALWALDTENQRETIDRKYAAVLATTSDAAMTVSLDGKITMFNPGAEKLFGCSTNEALGSPFSRFCPEDLLAEQTEIFRRVLDTGVIAGYESERLTADGRRVPVEISLALNVDDLGRPIGINAILRNISERKQADEFLRKNHAMLARTEHIANVGSWEWEIAEDRVSWSDEMFQIFERDTAAGAPSFSCHQNLYFPEDMQCLKEAVERCISQKTPYELELRAIRPNGEIRHCIARGQAETDEYDHVVRLAGSLQDITERKKQEEHITLLSHMVDEAPASITIHDVSGRFLYANRHTFSLHGYDENEFMAINLHDLDVPESAALLEERFRQIATKKEAPFEASHFRKDGTIFPLQILAKQVQWEGQPMVLSIASDISERRMAVEAQRRSEWYLRSTIDGLTTHIVVLDDQGEIILTNKAYRDFGEQNGIDPAAVSEGANYLAVCDNASGEHSEEAHPFVEGIREVIAGKRRYFELEYPCHSPNEKRWFIARVTLFSGEGPRRVVVAHENIIERKEAEFRLQLHSLVLNQIQDRVTVTDIEGIITYVNDASARALGYSADELIGYSTEKLGDDPERGATQREILQETLKHGKWRGEVVNQTADGQKLLLDCRTQLVFDKQGQIVALAGISTDITERRQAEELLRKSEEKFRGMAENLSDVLFFTNQQGEITYISPSIKQVFGYEIDEMLGQPFTNFLPEDQIPIAFRQFSHTLTTGKPTSSFELTMKRCGNEVFSGELNASVVITNNQITGTLGVIRDITNRKRAEEAVRESEKELRLTLDATTEGIWHWNFQTNSLFFSPRYYTMLGYEPDEFPATFEAWKNLLHPDDLNAAMSVVDKYLATKPDSYTNEFRMKTKSGEYLWIHATARIVEKDLNGEAIKLIGNHRDITEHKHYESILTFLAQSSADPASGDFFQLLARYISEALDMEFVCIDRLDGDNLTAHTVAVYSNGNFDDNISYALKDTPCGEVVGKQVCCFPSSIKNLFPNDTVLQQMNAESYVGVTLWSHDGHPTGLIAAIGARPLRHQEQAESLLKLVAVRAAAELERMQGEVARAALEDRLRQQQRLETVGQLAAGVAHDFNNLLTGISGYTLFAHDSLPTESVIRDDLSEVLTLSTRAAELTHQLLAFSRRQPLQPVVLNINEVITEAAKMLHRLLGEHLHLEFTLAKEIDMVKVDPGQFEQVLINLAVNARDAMRDGGKLTIETANTTLDESYAASHIGTEPGEYVMLAVTDTGHGMDKEIIERIFEPFFTTKGVGKGTGLGLATVYGIVKQHGGNIWVYSEIGHGTTFKVYLPRDSGECSSLVTTPLANIPISNATILVVEDNNTVRQIAQRYLEKAGYHVLVAALPSEAEAILQKQGETINLLLTDVVMPEKSGHQLYESVRHYFPHLRILYMSGYTANAIVHDGVLDPGTPFIEKPFTAEALTRKVYEVLTEGTDID